LAERGSSVERHDWPIGRDFDSGVIVDPFRRPHYYLVIRCDQCSETMESLAFVSGEANLGVIAMNGCAHFTTQRTYARAISAQMRVPPNKGLNLTGASRPSTLLGFCGRVAVRRPAPAG
jgi:hypothetical protein